MPEHNALFESEEKKKIASFYFYCRKVEKEKKIFQSSLKP